MKIKTKKRLKRRWENLPRFLVDSSIFIEIIFGQSKHRDCRTLFNLVGFKVRLESSSIVLGEVMKTIMKEKDLKLREDYLLLFNNLLSEYNIMIRTPSFNCFSLISKIRRVESRLGPMDCLIFSNCIDEGCQQFYTLDKDFSSNLKNKFKIKIVNPNFSLFP